MDEFETSKRSRELEEGVDEPNKRVRVDSDRLELFKRDRELEEGGMDESEPKRACETLSRRLREVDIAPNRERTKRERSNEPRSNEPEPKREKLNEFVFEPEPEPKPKRPRLN